MKEFFSPDVWRKQQAPIPGAAQCGLCKLYKTCKSPFMKPTGEGRKSVLILAEAPGENEDDKGIQLVGNAGFALIQTLRKLDINMRKDCHLHNAVICRPWKMEQGKKVNRTPTKEEVEYCRPNLTKTLGELKPNVVIPMGEVACSSIMALAWRPGEVDDMGSWAGWRIPSMRLNTWICPTYHPSFLVRSKEPVVEITILKHLNAAFDIESCPWPNGPPNYEDQLKIFLNPDDAVEWIEYLTQKGLETNRPMAFDYETTCLKPEGPYSEILCCSISDGEISIAYPWQGKAIEATKRFITSRVPKIAANITMENRWTRYKLKVAVNNWLDCTVNGGHWLNCRVGVSSLKFQAFVRLGMWDYDYILEPFKKPPKDEKNSYAPNRLKEVEPYELLKYCAYDSLFEVLVADLQQGRSYELDRE